MNQNLETNESNIINNSISTKKSNKKKIIVGLVVAIIIALVIGGIFVVKNMFGKNEDVPVVEDKFATYEITGTVELAEKSTEMINRFTESNESYKNLEHFVSKDKDGRLVVLDANGNKLMPVKGKELYKDSNVFYKYLGDGYFIYNTLEENDKIGTVVVKNGEVVTTLNEYAFIYMGYCHYKDGVLYASVNTREYTVAYDIAAKKELWRFDGYFFPNFLLESDYIPLSSLVNSSEDNLFFDDGAFNTLLDVNGNKIISGGDIAPKEGFTSVYDTKIFTSNSNVYLEYKEDDYVKVFDLNKNLKATLSLKETDTIYYNLTKVFDSGSFLISEVQKEPTKFIDILYNKDGKEILRGDIVALSELRKSSASYRFTKEYDLFEVRNDEGFSCVLVKDGEIIGRYSKCDTPRLYFSPIHHYIMVYEKDSVNPITYNGETYKILNINTMQSITAPIKHTYNTRIRNIGLNGAYVILTDGTTNYVYDSKFNKKYESNNLLLPVNDKYILSTNEDIVGNKDEIEFSLVNVETGKESIIDVKGEYYCVNSRGLVTFDGEFYYLYTFK